MLLPAIAIFLLLLTGCPSRQRGLVKPSYMSQYSGDTHKMIEAMVVYAKSFIGTRYQLWGTGKKGQGFDCSGFTQHVFKKFGVALARDAVSQFQQGDPVEREEMQRGDLIFFTTYKSGASHVGIYLGSGKFIHSPSSGEKVRIDKTNGYYWNGRWVGAKRIIR